MRSRPAGPWQTDPTAVVDLYMDTWTWKPRQIELIELRTAEHFVARISSRAKSAPRIHIHVRRTYSGRPSSSMRFSEATAMATSVVCRPSVRERSASPITRL